MLSKHPNSNMYTCVYAFTDIALVSNLQADMDTYRYIREKCDQITKKFITHKQEIGSCSLSLLRLSYFFSFFFWGKLAWNIKEVKRIYLFTRGISQETKKEKKIRKEKCVLPCTTCTDGIMRKTVHNPLARYSKVVCLAQPAKLGCIAS